MNKRLEVLLENSPIGYAYQKIITSSNQNTVDFVFLHFNTLFEQIMDIQKDTLLKHKFSEIHTAGEIAKLHQKKIFENIALHGGYETYISYSNHMKKWYKVHVFSPQKGFFITLFTDITNEREKLNQYESFFNINLDLLCITDLEGNFIKLNKEWEQLLGYEIKELEGRCFLDFVHPDDIGPTKEEMKKLTNNENVLNFCNRYLSKSGDYKIIEWRSHPHDNLIFAAARDVTKNRTKEKELMTILETTIDGFFIADIDGRLTRVNSAFCSMLGYERHELLQMGIPDFEAIESEEEVAYHKQKIMENGHDRFQTKHRRKDGKVLDVEISVTIFKVNTPQLVVFIRDISEQKKANLELVKREKQFSSLFWDSPVSILIHDIDTGKIIEANHKALSLYGVNSIDEFDFEQMMCGTPHSYEDAMRWIKRTVTEGPQDFEWQAKRKDGEVFWEMINLKIMDYYGKKTVMATGIDITELKEAQKKAEAAGKAKTEFLSNMSHEIRTPLNGIIGFADLLKNTPLDTAQKQFLESISLNANSLLSIVNDILDFSQIEEGKLHLEQTLSDLHELIAESVKSVQKEVFKKRLDLIVSIDEKLPQFAFIDHARLKQILNNLLSNAVKFTEKGKVELTVRFTPLREKTGSYFFSIKDTGIGMSKEQQNNIFKAFSQGDTSTTKKFGGTGLGLIISQRIALKMGSKIKFESELKKGSTFYFKLQANYKNSIEFEEQRFKEEKKEYKTYNPVRRDNEETKHSSSKFLIVDDVETSRFLFREYLKEYDKELKILEAKNGEEAVEMIKKEHPDLVLMDLYMPVLDGLKATKIIRDYEEKKQLKRTVIFALTATATKDQEKECYHTGMDAYLTKPLKKAQLYKKIQEFWTPPKKTTTHPDQLLINSVDHDLSSILTPLKEMLLRNDLSALDFLENNEEIFHNLGYTDHVKKVKKKIIDLNYKEALKEMNKITKASSKSSKRGQPNG